MGPMRANAAGHNPTSTGAGRETVMQEKYRNAYLLVYDRVETYDKEMKEKKAKEDEDNSPAPPTTTTTAEVVPGRPQLKRKTSEVRVNVPPKIFTQIWEQNITYWRDKAVFDDEYFQFLWDVVNSLQPEENKELVKPDPTDFGYLLTKLSTKFVFQTLARAKNKSTISQWMDLLKRLYTVSVPASVWLLDFLTNDPTGTSWSYNFLLGCPKPDIRRKASELFCQALSTVATLEDAKIGAAALEPPVESKDGSVQQGDRPYTVKYIDSIIRMLRDAPDYWKIFERYFYVLSRFAGMSKSCAEYAGSRHVAGRLVDFFLGDISPLPAIGDMGVDANGRRKRMGDDWNSPDLSFVWEAIHNVVCAHAPVSGASNVPSTLIAWPSDSDTIETPIPLPQADRQLLTCKDFLYHVMLQASTRKRGVHIAQMICHLCWENIALTKDIVGYISIGLEELTDDEIRPYFRMLMALVKIPDSVQNERVDLVLASYLGVMAVQQKYWKMTMTCAEHLIRMAKKVPQVYAWMNANFNKWEWVMGYISTYPKPPGVDSNIRFLKESRHGVQGYQQERGYQMYPGIPPRDKLAALEAIRDGAQLDTNNATDSDEDLNDRVFVLGQWVDCKDSVQKWIWAQVVGVHEDKVCIHFDGWSSKWDEWLLRGSSRIQTFFRCSNASRSEPQKGSGPNVGDEVGNGKLCTPELYAQVQPYKKQPGPIDPNELQAQYEAALLKKAQIAAGEAPPPEQGALPPMPGNAEGGSADMDGVTDGAMVPYNPDAEFYDDSNM